MNDNKSLRHGFPVGYHKFHRKKLYNFQLNRLYNFAGADLRDLEEAAGNISSFRTWKEQMLRLAEKAESKGNLIQAAFCYAAAGFYLFDDMDEKDRLYRRFRDLFNTAAEETGLKRFNAPYRDSYLPGIRMEPHGKKKQVIVLHGGFDSFIEEFYLMTRYFAGRGYEVIAFEGPGQGAARRECGFTFDIEWEKPVRAVIDHFSVEDVTLIGLSMGGWLCLRAAAFEPRVSRVIASGHAVDYMKSMPGFFYRIHKWFLEHHPEFMGRMAEWKFGGSRENMATWMVQQLKYITGEDKAMDALETYVMMNGRNIHSELVRQDVLLLLGEKDHFIPLKMLKMQEKALTVARSVTTRIFTEQEHAHNHCQIGNIGLSLEVMDEWMESIT
mgnify:FL=1